MCESKRAGNIPEVEFARQLSSPPVCSYTKFERIVLFLRIDKVGTIIKVRTSQVAQYAFPFVSTTNDRANSAIGEAGEFQQQSMEGFKKLAANYPLPITARM